MGGERVFIMRLSTVLTIAKILERVHIHRDMFDEPHGRGKKEMETRLTFEISVVAFLTFLLSNVEMGEIVSQLPHIW